MAALNALKQQQIVELLKSIPPAQAALLARAVAAMRVDGSDAQPTDLILEALAAAAEKAPAAPPSLRQCIFKPLEPFLSDGEQQVVSAGRIIASMVDAWWDALVATAGAELAAIELELLSLVGDDSQMQAAAIRARAAAAGWTANLLTVSPEAVLSAKVRTFIKNPQSRLALTQIFEILKEAELLMEAISALLSAAESAKVVHGGLLLDLPPSVVKVAKHHYKILAASNVVVTRYFALAIFNRLEKPWLIFRFTRALALQRDATIVANTEFGGIGERLVEDLEFTAALVDAANPRGRMSTHLVDFDRLRVLVERYVDCAEGVLNEIDLRRDSAWGEIFMRSRARMREALGDGRMQAAENAIRAVLGERVAQLPKNINRDTAATLPFAAILARAEQAIHLMNFIVQRGSRQGFASAARKTLDGLISEVEKCCEELIADLRLNPTDPFARSFLGPAILLVTQLIANERGEILTRRLNNERVTGSVS